MHSAFARIENHYFVNEVCFGNFFVYSTNWNVLGVYARRPALGGTEYR